LHKQDSIAARHCVSDGDPEDEEKDKIRMMRCDTEKYKEVYSI
jgi:hypothetical protein